MPEPKPSVVYLSPIGCTSCIVKSLGPVDPSFRALSGRLKFTVRRHTFDKDSLRQDQGGAGAAQGRKRKGAGKEEAAQSSQEPAAGGTVPRMSGIYRTYPSAEPLDPPPPRPPCLRSPLG